MIGRVWTALLKAASVRQWAMILGAIPMTALVCWIIYIVKQPGWGQPVLQLNILANLGYGPLIIIALIFVALTGTSIAANVGKGGASVSLQPDDEDAISAKIAGDVVITPEGKS